MITLHDKRERKTFTIAVFLVYIRLFKVIFVVVITCKGRSCDMAWRLKFIGNVRKKVRKKHDVEILSRGCEVVVIKHQQALAKIVANSQFFILSP